MANDKDIRGSDIFLYIFCRVFGITLSILVYIYNIITLPSSYPLFVI